MPDDPGTITIELTPAQAAALGVAILPVALEARLGTSSFPPEMLTALREVSMNILAAIEAQKNTNWDEVEKWRKS